MALRNPWLANAHWWLCRIAAIGERTEMSVHRFAHALWKVALSTLTLTFLDGGYDLEAGEFL